MNPTQRHKPPALKKSGERLYEDDHSGLAGDGLRKSATIAGAQFDRLVQVLAPEPLGLSRDIGEKLLFALQLIVIAVQTDEYRAIRRVCSRLVGTA